MLEETIDRIREKPYLMLMGANKVALQLKTTPEEVREAKRFLHKERFNKMK
jgi:hypothetical protein